jgi:hypothetical protein
VALIKEMASNNRLWGAERIRGELLKLGIHVCKRTIQKYMKSVRAASVNACVNLRRDNFDPPFILCFLPVNNLQGSHSHLFCH